MYIRLKAVLKRVGQNLCSADLNTGISGGAPKWRLPKWRLVFFRQSDDWKFFRQSVDCIFPAKWRLEIFSAKCRLSFSAKWRLSFLSWQKDDRFFMVVSLPASTGKLSTMKIRSSFCQILKFAITYACYYIVYVYVRNILIYFARVTRLHGSIMCWSRLQSRFLFCNNTSGFFKTCFLFNTWRYI